MFTNRDMQIGDWWLFFILIAIPLVNIFVIINIILSSTVNRSLKNYVLAIILPFIIILGFELIFISIFPVFSI
ncbi:MAG: hypothetical protein K9L26_01140 [Candidatus Izimaplasma sp.]|nr:hypothetical protein [Candidatus Izimaplasma bacterium]